MKTRKRVLRGLLILLLIIAAVLAAGVVQFFYRSGAGSVRQYDTDNPFISGTTAISAHRSGAGNFPEETLAAFRGCVEDPTLQIDYFEFDLHMTADQVLVLTHDDELDRVSDAEEVFGEEEVRVGDKTLAELQQLNMAAQFTDAEGNQPYAGLHGSDVPDEVRILTLDEALDYLSAAGDYRYIIEIKNGGETGKAAADRLYATLKARGLLDRVIIGCFLEEISEYVTQTYPDAHRGACTEEVAEFYFAALLNQKDFTCGYDVLQLPFNDVEESYGVNLGLARIINYAHAHNIAVQYWTVNREKDMAYLAKIGADALITDYPDRAAEVLRNLDKTA